MRCAGACSISSCVTLPPGRLICTLGFHRFPWSVPWFCNLSCTLSFLRKVGIKFRRNMQNQGTGQIAKPRYRSRKSRKTKGTGQILKTTNPRYRSPHPCWSVPWVFRDSLDLYLGFVFQKPLKPHWVASETLLRKNRQNQGTDRYRSPHSCWPVPWIWLVFLVCTLFLCFECLGAALW